jgi:hypothetical protein
MRPGFTVDPEALTRLSADLRKLHDDLTSPSNGQVIPDTSVTGDATVTDAIDHFVNNWRDGRNRIADALEKCARGLESAAHSYIAVDRCEATTFGAEGSP